MILTTCKSFLCFILVFISSQYFAQKSEKTIPSYNDRIEIHPSIAIHNDFNLDDWYIGLSGGIEDVGYQWGARFGFGFRPFRKKILTIENDFITRQFMERKYFLFFDFDKRLGHIVLFNQHLQFYFGVRTGLLMGNYSGTRNNPDPHMVVAPIGGICFNFNDKSYIKIGYNHFSDRILNVDDGRINLSFVFNLINH